MAGVAVAGLSAGRARAPRGSVRCTCAQPALKPLPWARPAPQVRTGLGSLPADFDAVARRAPGGLPSAASNLARWEAYAAAHMYDPSAKL